MEIYKLLYPVEYAGETLTEITLLRPKGREVRKIDINNIDLDQLLTMAGKCLGGDLSHVVIDLLDAADCIAIAEVYGGFLASGREIGGSS